MARLKLLTVVGLFALGFVRIAYDSIEVEPLTNESADALGLCLKPFGDIPVATPITLKQVPANEAKGKPQAAREAPPVRVEVVTTAPITVELLTDEAAHMAGQKDDPAFANRPRAVLTKASGSFELRARDADFLVMRDKIALRHKTDDVVRFAATTGASYVVILPETIKAGEAKTATLPSGTVGLVELGAGIAVEPLQPLAVFNWMKDVPSTLSAVRVSGQAGLADISLEVRQPGLAFDAVGFSLSSCASIDHGKTWQAAGVAETRARETGVARALVVLPPNMLVTTKLMVPLHIAIASPDGRYRGYGGFKAMSKSWAAIISMVMTVFLLWWLLTLRHEDADSGSAAKYSARWYSGLFVGEDNEPSLALFQIFVWTTITVWGFVYVYLVSGSLLAMTTEMMALLGIAGVGTLASRWVTTTRGAPGTAAPAAAPAEPEDFAFWKILSTNGTFDLLKLQLLVFTLTIAAYVVYRILDSAAFPVLDPNTLLLLGVSQGVYVGGKLVSSTPLATAQSLKLQLDTYSDALTRLKAQLDDLQKAKADLEAKGDAASEQDKKRLTELPGEIAVKQRDVADVQAKYDKTRADYDTAVKAVFPAPT